MMFVLELLATYSEILTGYYFVSGVSKQIQKKWKEWLFLTAILTSVVFYVNITAAIYSVWLTAFVFISIVFSSFLLEHTPLIDIISTTTFYFILMHLFDFLTMALLGLINGQPSLPAELVENFSFERCIFIIFSKICLISSSCFIRKFIHESFGSVKINIFFSVTGILMIWFLGSQTFDGTNQNLVATWFIFAGFLFSTLFLFNYYIAYKNQIWEQQTAEIKNAFLSEKIKNSIRLDQEQKKLIHDINGHLSILYEIINNHNLDKALNYIRQLIEPVSCHELSAWTGNEIVDYILNAYQQKAACENARMEIDSDYVLFAGKSSHDLCTIFNNLLDNALEAIKRKTSGEKKIDVSIRQFGNMILIQIVNSISDTPKMKNGKLVTTKSAAAHHGIGIKSVQDAVAKYDGLFTFRYDTEHFIAEITFFTS